MTFQATASAPSQRTTGGPSLDNFTLAQAVPEPSAILLAIGAVAIVSGARRRGRRS